MHPTAQPLDPPVEDSKSASHTGPRPAPSTPRRGEPPASDRISVPDDVTSEASAADKENTDSQGSAPSPNPKLPPTPQSAPQPTPQTPPQPVEALSTSGKWLVGIGIALWLGIYLGGTTVDSAPFRKAISEEGLIATVGKDAAAEVNGYDGPMVTAIFVALFFYTPTNLAMLTLLAGLLGTLGRKASLYPNAEADKDADPINPKLSAFLRSFLVYLVFVSGVLVFAEAPFSSPSPTSYLRLAGLMSLMSFVANYRPRFFASILEGALGYLDANGRTKDSKEGTA